VSETYTILTPLPQLKLSIDLPNYNLEEGLSIRPLEPQIRRSLLNLAKEQEECSDDIFLLLTESELVFCAEIPSTGKKKVNKILLPALMYHSIAEEILKRVFRCLLLFEWVPEPLLFYCWFLATGSADSMDLDSFKMLTPEWQHIDQFTNIDWRTGHVEPEDITLGMAGLQTYWDKLSIFCQIDALKRIYIDKKKEKEIVAAVNKYVLKKVEELMKAKYGPDAVLLDSDDDANSGEKSNDDNLPKSKISRAMRDRWFIGGLAQAYSNEVDKLSQKLYKKPSDKKFVRAFQFFTEAFRLQEPHRFIAFATCLETLFCTNRSEITFQLASRIAWFLYPDDCKERFNVFNKVKSLYKLRSEIVHGTKYSHTKIVNAEGEAIDFAREVFCKILSDDKIYNIFLNKDQNSLKKYLEGLNLGQDRQKEIDKRQRDN